MLHIRALTALELGLEVCAIPAGLMLLFSLSQGVVGTLYFQLVWNSPGADLHTFVEDPQVK